jgi:hypothetical protein
MRLSLYFIGLVCAFATMGHALERTVALPYDYSRSVNQVYVPPCTESQYVAVSESRFICRDLPTSNKIGTYIISKKASVQTYLPNTSYVADKDLFIAANERGTGETQSNCWIVGDMNGKELTENYVKPGNPAISFIVPKGNSWAVRIRNDKYCKPSDWGIAVLPLSE